MRLRIFLVVLLLVAPLVVARRARQPMEAAAHGAGAFLGRVVPQLPTDGLGSEGPAATGPTPGGADEPAREPGEADPAILVDTVESAAGRGKSGGAHHRRATARRRRALHVSAATVLALAEDRYVPSGTSVPATARRPAGIELSGVAPLDIGVEDGDVLTQVDGRAVGTEGQVIAAVIAARSRRAPRMSALFFRGAEEWALVVDMPYLDGR